MIDADADIAAMMAAGDFSQSVTVAGATITADFTDATDAVNLLDGRVEAHEPTLICATADVENVIRGATAVVNGTSYTVDRKQKIGTGQSVLYLKT